MSYIWNCLLKAEEMGIDKNKIEFVNAEICSPYMEVSFEDLNTKVLPEDNKIEVNIYYRFYEIFKELFDINYEEDKEIRNVLLDIILHFLGKLDLKSGISKKELYKKFILQDIKNKVFGENLANNINAFNKRELDSVLDGILTLYTTGTSLYLFRKVLTSVFKDSSIYASKDNVKKIYIYLAEKRDSLKISKIQGIIDTFLPINNETLIFWDKHFGIVGVDSTMIIDNMIMVE